VADRVAVAIALDKVVPLGDHVRPGHAAKFVRLLDAGKGHEIPDRVFVGALGCFVGQVGEAFDFAVGISARRKKYSAVNSRVWETAWMRFWDSVMGISLLLIIHYRE
jgi:hypothetical protein